MWEHVLEMLVTSNIQFSPAEVARPTSISTGLNSRCYSGRSFGDCGSLFRRSRATGAAFFLAGWEFPTRVREAASDVCAGGKWHTKPTCGNTESSCGVGESRRRASLGSGGLHHSLVNQSEIPLWSKRDRDRWLRLVGNPENAQVGNGPSICGAAKKTSSSVHDSANPGADRGLSQTGLE